MIEIDGTFGEGGGQILRTALSLSAVTGKPMHMTGIRAKRRNPGLKRQHLTCIRAAAAITEGNAPGAEINSREITFMPGSIRGGDYHFAVGSAGSTVLIAQTVIPILLNADRNSRIAIEGGTHTDQAPVYEFFNHVYLPALRKMGAYVTARLERTGFFPAGGGRIVLEIRPTKSWTAYECMSSGNLLSASLTAAGHEIDKTILKDEISLCIASLPEGLVQKTATVDVDSVGPGNFLYARLDFENITELFSCCGSVDISRHDVACRVSGMLKKYLDLQAPVGRFLADQLLLPMALGAGGKYLTHAPSKHTLTNIEVIKRFMQVGIELENCKNGTYVIKVKK